MAQVSAEDRQTAIDIMTEALVGQGVDEETAQAFATEATDEAIKQQDS